MPYFGVLLSQTQAKVKFLLELSFISYMQKKIDFIKKNKNKTNQ